MVDEMTQATVLFGAFKEGNAPAIGMVVRHARALRETAEAEGRIRRVFAIETEQLAHGMFRGENLGGLGAGLANTSLALRVSGDAG